MSTSPREEIIRQSNLSTLQSTRNTLSTSLGPYGLDKLIINDKVVVTNDGCTILTEINKRNNKNEDENAIHPLNNMILSLSTHQDKIAGDGTTSVVVITASLFEKGCELIDEGVPRAHVIREMENLKKQVSEWIVKKRIPIITENNGMTDNTINQIDLSNPSHYSTFYDAVKTSLSSKILNSVIDTVVPIAIQTLKFKKISHVKVLGDGMEDSRLLQGMVFNLVEKNYIDDKLIIEKEDFYDSNEIYYDQIRFQLKPEKVSFTRRIAILQYPLSAPKPNIDSKIEISSNIDKIIKEEKDYIFKKVKELKKQRIDFLFIQKNILRDSVSDLADYFLKRLNMSYAVLERKEIESLSNEMCLQRSVEGKINVNSVDLRYYDGMLRVVEKVEDEIDLSSLKIKATNDVVKEINLQEESTSTKIDEIKSEKVISQEIQKKDDLIRKYSIGSLILTGSDQTILDESSRSFNDAIMVVNSLHDEPYIVAGGGSVEMNLIKLQRESIIQQKIINGLEIIPFYLCKNAGHNYFTIRGTSDDEKDQKEKKEFDVTKGIDLINGEIVDLIDKGIIIPSKVVRSYLEVGFETAAFLLSIDDILPSRV